MDLSPAGYAVEFSGEGWGYPVYSPPPPYSEDGCFGESWSYQTHSPPPFSRTHPLIHQTYSFTPSYPLPLRPPDPPPTFFQIQPPDSYQIHSPSPYYQSQSSIHHNFTPPGPPPSYQTFTPLDPTPSYPISQTNTYHYQQTPVVSEDVVNFAHASHMLQIHTEAMNKFQRSFEASLDKVLVGLDKVFDKAFASFTSASLELEEKLKHRLKHRSVPRAQAELPSGINSVASHLDARSESSPTGSLTMARPEKVPIDPTVSDVASSSLSPLSCRSTIYSYPLSAMSFLKAQRPRACFKRYRVKNKRHGRQNKTAYYAGNGITSQVDSGEVNDVTDRVLATLKMKLLSANACLDDAEGKADVNLREMSVYAVGRLAQDSHHQGVFKDQTTTKFSDVEESVDGVQSSVTAILEELKSMRAEARAVHISFGSVTAPLGTSSLALEASESSTRATTTSTAVVSPDAQEILPRTSDYPLNLGDNDVLLGFISEVDTDVINNTSSVQAARVISVNGSRVNELDKGKGIDGGGEAVVSAMQDVGMRKKVKEMGMMSRKAVEDEGSSSVSQTVSLSDNTVNQITKLLLNSRIVSLPWNCVCQRVSGVIVDRNVNELEVLGLKGQRLVFEVLADDSRLVDDSVETYNDSCQRKGSVYVCELFDKMKEAEKSEAFVKLGLLWEPKVLNSLINLGGKSRCLEAVCPDDSTVLFYDLLGTNGSASGVDFGWPRGKGSNTKGRLEVMGMKSYELDSSDPFGAANSSLAFPEVAGEIESQLSKYKREVDEVNRNTGGTDTEFDRTYVIGSTKNLISAVNPSPELTARKQVIDKHTHIAIVLWGHLNVVLYNKDTAEKLFTLNGEHTQPICALAWSPNGKYLATSGLDKQVLIWNVDQKQDIGRHKFIERITCLAWKPIGIVLAVIDCMGSTSGGLSDLSEYTYEESKPPSRKRLSKQSDSLRDLEDNDNDEFALPPKVDYYKKVRRHHDESIDNGNEVRCRMSSVRPKMQEAFQPGDIPVQPGKRHFLCYNRHVAITVQNGSLLLYGISMLAKMEQGWKRKYKSQVSTSLLGTMLLATRITCMMKMWRGELPAMHLLKVWKEDVEGSMVTVFGSGAQNAFTLGLFCALPQGGLFKLAQGLLTDYALHLQNLAKLLGTLACVAAFSFTYCIDKIPLVCFEILGKNNEKLKLVVKFYKGGWIVMILISDA